MKKLLSLSLALVLTLSLAAPALAAGPEPGLSAIQVMDELGVLEGDVVILPEESPAAVDYDALREEWMAAHPEEVGAFDADAWFASQMGDGMTKAQYLAFHHLTEEEFRAEMLDYWVATRLFQAQQQAEVDAFLAGHPGALDGFDADAWFRQHYDYYESKEEYMQYWSQTEEDFRLEMALEYIYSIQAQEERDRRIASYEAEHPGAFAAFDADGWFAEHYSWYTKEEYMSSWGVDGEAAFREEMFLEYLDVLDEREARRQAVDDYLAEHPGALDGFDPMAYLSARFDYRDPKAAFMEDYGLETEEDFVTYLQYEYITALQEKALLRDIVAAYEAEHPGTVAGFDADAFLAERYPYYSKAEFMSDNGLDTEEEFRDYLLRQWILGQQYGLDLWGGADYDGEKTALGGVPGELGVMVDGVYLTFGGKKPYAQDGAVYVPAGALSQALGQEPQTVTTSGYAPLRASAEAAGCAVWWDPDFETAVLIRPAQLSGALDEQFTILNAALEQWGRDPAKNYKTTATVAIDATLFNSIDGDRTYAMTAALEALTAPGGMSLSGEYDLSAMKELLREAMGEELYGYLAQDGELEALLDLLSRGDFELRADYETGSLYLTASSFPTLFSIMGRTYSKDVWLSWESAAGLPAGSGTVGASLAAYALMMAEQSGLSPVYYHQAAAGYAETCAAVLGDANFEARGGDRVLSLDAETLSALIYSLLGYDAYDYMDYLSFRELALELTVKADGAVTGSFAFRPQTAFSALADLRVAGDWSADGQGERASMEYHLKNFFKLSITVESETRPTGQKPETAPPEKAAVVPMDQVA